MSSNDKFVLDEFGDRIFRFETYQRFVVGGECLFLDRSFNKKMGNGLLL
jgi:hypothetical protein